MDHFLTIWSIVTYVESRLQGEIDLAELGRAMGFSLAHLREVFAARTGKSLSRYILGRRIAGAAFEIIHSDRSILEIAIKYGFSNPDTFTRAFRRVTGKTPLSFRKERCPVGRTRLCAGVWGVGIVKADKREDEKA